jgi:hypothetical protein
VLALFLSILFEHCRQLKDRSQRVCFDEGQSASTSTRAVGETPPTSSSLPLSTSSHLSVMVPRIFFITGTTTGFGYELVKHVIAQGDVAVATSRNPDALSFEGTTPKVRLSNLPVLTRASTDAGRV